MNTARRLMVVSLVAGLACAAVTAQSPFNPYSGSAPLGRYQPYSLHTQSAQLAHQYVKAVKEDEKKALREKLTDALGQQFDQHVQQQQREIKELEKQLASLKALLKKRVGAKTAIVERRLEQLVQAAEGLGWNGPDYPQFGLTRTDGFSGHLGQQGPSPASSGAPAKGPESRDKP
jgi:uncharacterized protein YlxW (UPF0749 family)